MLNPYKDYLIEDDRILEQPPSLWGLGERIVEALAVVLSLGLVVAFIVWWAL